MFARMAELKEQPLILVTNDDGITARGIEVLARVASTMGQVVIVAPDKPQSGMGHAVTISGILRLHKVGFADGLPAYACSGTPVDCVKLAIYRVMKRKPDLLVSGINHGSNSSINVIYSGTMSAALEGAVEGIPSIGFSLQHFSSNADFGNAEPVVRTLMQNALNHGMAEGICLNVNIPRTKPGEIRGIKICRQAKAIWEDSFDLRTDPSGQEYYWLTGEFKNHDRGEDTDEFALANKYVSVVPVQYDLTAYHAMQHLNQWEL